MPAATVSTRSWPATAIATTRCSTWCGTWPRAVATRPSGRNLLAVGVDRAAGGDRAGPGAGVDPGPEDRAGHAGRDGFDQVLGPARLRVVGQRALPLNLGPQGHAGRLADLDELRAARLGQAELLERAE